MPSGPQRRFIVEMRRGSVEVRGGGPGRRSVRQETSRFLSTEDETRLRTNLGLRRTGTEVEEMDVFDDAASDRGSVRNIITHMEGRDSSSSSRGQYVRTMHRPLDRKGAVDRVSSRGLLVREMSLMWVGG